MMQMHIGSIFGCPRPSMIYHICYQIPKHLNGVLEMAGCGSRQIINNWLGSSVDVLVTTIVISGQFASEWRAHSSPIVPMGGDREETLLICSSGTGVNSILWPITRPTWHLAWGRTGAGEI
eukprot:3033796-Karenia_brevis.AAC.1